MHFSVLIREDSLFSGWQSTQSPTVSQDEENKSVESYPYMEHEHTKRKEVRNSGFINHLCALAFFQYWWSTKWELFLFLKKTSSFSVIIRVPQSKFPGIITCKSQWTQFCTCNRETRCFMRLLPIPLTRTVAWLFYCFTLLSLWCLVILVTCLWISVAFSLCLSLEQCLFFLILTLPLYGYIEAPCAQNDKFEMIVGFL